MNELNLKIEEGTIISIIFTIIGRIYIVKTEKEERKIITRFYDNVSEYLSKEYGCDIEYAKDKSIYLISDEDRLLALKNEKDSLVFIRDFINENYETITTYGNTDHIKDKYNLTEEEFIEIVRKDIQTRKLTLN